MDRKTQEFYRRRLPHWQPKGVTIFITFRLAGSLPKRVLEELAQLRKRLDDESNCGGEDPREREIRHAKTVFVEMDKALGRMSAQGQRGCPTWLADVRIARIVRASLSRWEGVRYCLHRYVIMPNHVHVLLQPLPTMGEQHEAEKRNVTERQYWPMSEIVRGLKGCSAKRANEILGRHGAFWQDERYDHWVRDEGEYHRITKYIDRNPVVAGLCDTPTDWKWSSAGEERITG